MFYVAYDAATGAIRQKGSSQPGVTPIVVGSSILELTALQYNAIDNTAFAWVDGAAGAVVKYTGVEIAARSAPPSDAAIWDDATRSWRDERTIEQLRAAKWERVKTDRNVAEFGGFSWDGSQFDSDEASQSRIQGAAQLATLAMLGGEAFSVDWTLADNAVRTLSGADVLGVGRSMGEHIVTVHATGRALRAAIESAGSAAELDAILWPEN